MTLLVCARCFGYALVFFPLFLLQFFNLFQFANYDKLVLYLLPLPAHVEWIYEKFSKKGNNLIRLVSGCLLGVGASYILIAVIKQPLEVEPYLIVGAYFLLAILGYLLSRLSKMPTA